MTPPGVESRAPKLRILFLVSRLGGGGAERQLAALATGLAERGHDVVIGVYRRGGDYEVDIEKTPVRLVSFEKGTFWDLWGFFRRVLQMTRALKPHIVHGYMDTGNIVAAALRLRAHRPRVVWGIRSSRLELKLYDYAGRILFQLTRPVSRAADLIIANSSPGARDVIAAGYPADRVLVIHNGIEVERFRPDAAGGEHLRTAWSVPMGAPVIGMAARLDPMKGHDLFVQAARLLLARRPTARFLCVGEGAEPYRSQVLATLQRADLGAALAWHGSVRDMSAFYSAVTIHTCCSRFGEGFSNAIAEAMACGVPCVVTDVGDLPLIVGETGIVVPCENPAALADAWDRLIDKAGPDRSAACRARIVEHFALASLIDATERALQGLVR